MRKFNGGDAEGRTIFAAIYSFFERAFSPLSKDKNYSDEIKEGENFWKNNFPDIFKANSKDTLKWIEKIKQTPFTAENAMEFKTNMGNCIISLLTQDKDFIISFMQKLHKPTEEEWGVIANYLKANIIIYEDGEKKFELRTRESIFEEPLTVVEGKDFSGVLYTVEQALVLGDSKNEYNNIDKNELEKMKNKKKPIEKPKQPEEDWKAKYEEEVKKAREATELNGNLAFVIIDMIKANGGLIEALHNVGKKRETSNLPTAIKKIGESMNKANQRINEMEMVEKREKNEAKTCLQNYNDYEKVILTETMEIIKNGLKPQPAPQVIEKKEKKCNNCYKTKGIAYLHNEKCNTCRECIIE